MSKKFSMGQASIEYAVVCAALAAVVALDMSREQSAISELLSGFRTAYQRISYSLSIPV